MDNRKTRRAKHSGFRKELKTAKFDEFENITAQALEMGGFPEKMGKLTGFFKNSIYSVQVYERENCTLLGIRRHDQKASCPWSHKQKIKNYILNDDYYAIEIFPPESELVDQANMYWLWASYRIEKLCKSLGGI